MPDEQLDKLEAATRGLPVWLKVFIGLAVGVAMAFNTVKSIQIEYFPELFATEVEQATIHKDVKALKDSVKAELLLEISDALKQSDRTHSAIYSKISGLSTQIEAIIGIQDANQKHRNWNTKAISIHSELFREQLKRKTRTLCPERVYYESNSGDDWNIFDCQYQSKMMYSIDRRSDCREYYTPIGGTKIQAP